MIPMLDLTLQYEMLQAEIDAAIASVLRNSQYIMGINVKRFEIEVAEYLGVKHAISCNSGTDALHLALCACGIGKNDEVITSPFSFVAAAEAICHVGATPVFVDIDPITYNLSVERIGDVITEKTRAILPVHIFGKAVDMHAVCKLAQQYELLVIEDCAQSFGARIGHQHTGTFGDAGCFSFFPSKNLGCFGDGGLFTTNSDELAEQFMLLRNHGSKTSHQHQIIGWNSRLDELQAAVLRIKLKHVDGFNQKRIAVAKKYNELLTSLPIQLPVFKDDLSHVFHQYTLLSTLRNRIAKQLHASRIDHAIYYPMPLPEQKSLAGAVRKFGLSNTSMICNTCISLPIFPEMSEAQIETVANAMKQVYIDYE